MVFEFCQNAIFHTDQQIISSFPIKTISKFDHFIDISKFQQCVGLQTRISDCGHRIIVEALDRIVSFLVCISKRLCYKTLISIYKNFYYLRIQSFLD